MTNRRTTSILLAALLLLVLHAGIASADTNINITIEETVNQNVTFAENFQLVENRTYSLIEGVVTISNPGTATVQDVYVYFTNIDNLDTDFVYTSGREGFQRVYPDVTNNTFNTTQNITSSGYTNISYDLDEDGLTDSVTHNDTHLIFNISSEYELFSVGFSNASNNSLDISAGNVPLDMQFDIVSAREDLSYNDGVTFANVSLTGTAATPSVLDPAEITLTIVDHARDYAVVHVPQLRPGNQTVFLYNVSSVSVEPPLNIDTQYTNPEFNTKVLAGERFGVRLSAENIATVGALENVNITLRAEQVNVTNNTAWQNFNFTLHNLSNGSTSDDYTSVDNSSNRTWYWAVNGGTIPVGETHNISFQIRAPDTVSSSGTLLAMTQLLAYRIGTTASTLDVSEVRAGAATRFNTTKRIVSPADNLSNNNVTWASDPNVGTAENITFTLEKVSLWVTAVRDPNEVANNLTYDYNLNYDFNQTNGWSGGSWYFNFTDGSSSANPPPIVWVKPYWIIKNTANQIVNSSVTINGTDLYMNYIYVVNGYWLEVDKEVLDTGDRQYDINILVRNRGNGYTPQNMTVTVYDFIPDNFQAYAFSNNPDNSSAVTGEFAGTAYQWDVGLRTNLSTSFSPRGAADGLDTYTLNYSVNGTGDFQVSDLYIVGLDPRLVDGANTYEGVAVISAIASTSREVLYLAIVVFLIGINVANFLMTSKINRKLGP